MSLFASLKPVRMGLLSLCVLGIVSPVSADEVVTPDPKDLIRAAMNHWRGVTSYSDMTMTVHRSDWQRTMSMQSHVRSVIFVRCNSLKNFGRDS